MTIKQIDDRMLWDGFVLKNNPLSFFQFWLWGEVEKALGTEVIRLGLFENKKLIGVSQIFAVKAKRGRYLHIRHGPVFIKNVKESAIKYWFESVKKRAREEKYAFMRISPLIKMETRLFWEKEGFLKAPTHNVDSEICLMIDLSQSEDQLLFNMRKTTRYLIKKAQKMEVKVVSGANEAFFKRFAKLFKKTAKRKKFIFQRGINEEFQIFSSENKAFIYLAEYKDIDLAGALVVFEGNQAIYHHAASADKLRHVPASYLMQWQIIKEAKRRGYKFYNLWGVVKEKDPSHPWYGLTLFKNGFGGETIEYMHAMDFPLESSYQWIKAVEKSIKYVRGYEKIGCFRCPPWIRNVLGV